jgi:hypothetical protein
MRHLLLSGAALLALVYPANSVTMQIGYMGQDITGPPEPYTFFITAASNGNIISDHRMVGTWEVTVMFGEFGVVHWVTSGDHGHTVVCCSPDFTSAGACRSPDVSWWVDRHRSLDSTQTQSRSRTRQSRTASPNSVQ